MRVMGWAWNGTWDTSSPERLAFPSVPERDADRRLQSNVMRDSTNFSELAEFGS